MRTLPLGHSVRPSEGCADADYVRTYLRTDGEGEDDGDGDDDDGDDNDDDDDDDDVSRMSTAATKSRP